MIKENEESEFSRMKKVIMSCVAGSSLEWYDFAVYGFFATLIGQLFFPSGDEFMQLLASYGAFAAGLIVRPLGAILFGYIGDIWGRKKALVISIYMMAVPTALMGLLPTYEQIGVAAGVILTLIRIIQGLALGGGFTGTIVFLYEHSSKNTKSTYSAWAPFSLVSGFILGALVATFMNWICNDEQLALYGWRIPFILSFLGTVIAEFVKRRLDDPKEFLEQQKKEDPNEKKSLLRNLFKNHWKGVVLVTLTDVLTACGYFLISIFFTSYFEKFIHLGRQAAATIQMINMIFFALFILLGGWLADRLGKPIFSLFCEATFWSALFAQMGIIFIFSMYYGPIPATICSMFPTKVRLLGVSFAHNFAMAAFGAYAPNWAVHLIQWTGNISSPAILFAVSAFITAVALAVWKEGKEY